MLQTPPAPRDERDLSFHPVHNPAPRTLSRVQIDHFNEHGYLTGLTIFGAEEARELRDYFDWLLAKTAEQGGSSYDVLGYHDRCQRLYDLCVNPRILDIMEDLLGPDFVCWVTHAFAKMPGDPKVVPWHQDASYWPLTPSRTITVWLAIDDVDRENAAMRYIPGSHRLGHLDFVQRTENVVLHQEVEHAEQYGRPVDVELQAGQIALHSDLLLHGSGANRSTRRRCGLTLRYAPTSVRPLKPLWGQALIPCRGRDDFGHWGAPVPRPPGEDPSLPPWMTAKPE